MAWPAQLGIPVTILHPVRDVNGDFVAGQGASVVATMLGPDRAPATGVLIPFGTDIATGWVAFTFTFNGPLGIYTLELTNPGFPTADGRTEPYTIIVTAGVATSVTLLTSRDRVRTRLQLTNADGTPVGPLDAHPFDALIDLLISEVSEEYQDRLGRTLAETAYVEYLDGSGRGSLVLGAGPLVSFTALEIVDYLDDGAGGVTESLTVVPRHSYVLAGLRSQPRYTGLARIDLIGGVFDRGSRNYRVAYTGGFSPLPEGIVGLATTDVVYRLMTRQTGHLLSQTLGDGTISFLRPQQMLEAREAVLSTYLREAA